MSDRIHGHALETVTSLEAHIDKLEMANAKLKDEVGDEWARAGQAEAKVAALKAENAALLAKGTPGWLKLRDLEAERDELRLMVQNWYESENEPDDELCSAYSFYLELWGRRNDVSS